MAEHSSCYLNCFECPYEDCIKYRASKNVLLAHGIVEPDVDNFLGLEEPDMQLPETQLKNKEKYIKNREKIKERARKYYWKRKSSQTKHN